MNKEKEIPTIDLEMKTINVESGFVYCPYILINTPYIILCDKDGVRKVWTKNKLKIILYYLFEITHIKWFILKYNKH